MPGICDAPIIGEACDAAGEAAAGAADAVFGSAARSSAEGFGKMVELMTSFWVQVPTPALDGAAGPVALMRENTSWLTAAIGVLSVLIAAGRMALTREGRAAADSAKGLLQFVLLSSAGVAALSALVEFGDAYSTWIIDRAAGGDLAKTLAPLTMLSQLSGPLGSIVVLVLAIFGIGSSFVQLGMMLVRSGILIVLAGMLGVAGAAGINSGGRQTRDKVVAWALAFALYKPVAATGYAGAFLATGKGSDVVTKMSGIFLIIIAVFALPALMRVLTPAVSAVTSGGSGGGAAGGAVASGAVQVLGGMGRSSSSSSAPSGASGGGSNPSGAGLVGADGRSGAAGNAGGQGTAGAAGAGTAGAQTAGAAQGASGAAAAGGASGGAAAGAAGGPVGAGIGAAIGAGAQATGAIKQTAQRAADQEGTK